MEKWKWKFQNFMQGRNGLDELTKVVYAGSIIVYVISLFTGSSLLYYLAIAGIVYGVSRVFSKDVLNRQAENRKLIQKMDFYKTRQEQRKTHKIFKCKGCGRKIRVPRGKGKIEVTCPVCGHKEIHRT